MHRTIFTPPPPSNTTHAAKKYLFGPSVNNAEVEKLWTRANHKEQKVQFYGNVREENLTNGADNTSDDLCASSGPKAAIKALQKAFSQDGTELLPYGIAKEGIF